MSLQAPCEEAVAWVIQQLGKAGLGVVRTFDLKVARLLQPECPCPHHGTEKCDCQMIVLLIYADDRGPVSFVAHGYEGKTWFSLVNTPQQHADSFLSRIIQQNLVHEVLLGFDPSNLPHDTFKTV